MTSLDPSFINCNTLEKEGEKKAEAETENMIHLYTGLATILKHKLKNYFLSTVLYQEALAVPTPDVSGLLLSSPVSLMFTTLPSNIFQTSDQSTI